MDDTAPQFLHHPLFSTLNAAQRSTVIACSSRRRLAAGETLFAQGNPAKRFWWLERGQIKLYRLSDNGHQKIMGLVTPHQSFAEGILFMDTPHYPVSAEAITSSHVIGFEREAYLGILEHSFPACRALFRQMVRRTQHHLDEIEALTIRNARFRLIHFLLRMQGAADGRKTFELPVRKHLIAGLLAVQPETLSRLLHELETEGLVHVRGNRIEILDAESLQSLLA